MPGKLKKLILKMKSQETFGVGKIEDFTQQQLIDLYACVECGRCTNMCPATGTGKMLSPMDLIVKLRDHLTNQVQRLHRNSHGYRRLPLQYKREIKLPSIKRSRGRRGCS